jgi:hypothetical protein
MLLGELTQLLVDDFLGLSSISALEQLNWSSDNGKALLVKKDDRATMVLVMGNYGCMRSSAAGTWRSSRQIGAKNVNRETGPL